MGQQVQDEAIALADLLWLYHGEEEGKLSSLRYGNALRWPFQESGWAVLIHEATARRSQAQMGLCQ